MKALSQSRLAQRPVGQTLRLSQTNLPRTSGGVSRPLFQIDSAETMIEGVGVGCLMTNNARWRIDFPQIFDSQARVTRHLTRVCSSRTKAYVCYEHDVR